MNEQIERVVADIRNKLWMLDVRGEVDSNFPTLLITVRWGDRWLSASVLLSVVMSDECQDYVNHLSKKIRRKLIGY